MTNVQKICRFLIFLSNSILFIYGCTGKDYNKSDPAQSFARARESYDNEMYDIALTKLGEFKSRFPYSKYAAMAELFIANCHFELESFEEATLAYSRFIKLHPKHEKVDFAMYRIGESYWADAPEEVDRDQEFTHKAIEEWGKLVRRFPRSSYTKKAKKHITTGRRRIAESYEFIANFYCKMEMYHSCAYKFAMLVEKFPQYPDLVRKALEKTALSLDHLAEMKSKDTTSDKNIYFKSLSAEEMRREAAKLRKRLASLPKPKE